MFLTGCGFFEHEQRSSYGRMFFVLDGNATHDSKWQRRAKLDITQTKGQVG